MASENSTATQRTVKCPDCVKDWGHSYCGTCNGLGVLIANDAAPSNPITASPKPTTEVSVYLDSGVVYFYSVSDRIKGREHAAAIIRTGYRHTPEGSDDLEWFPPHRIVKVKVVGGGALSVYKDQVRPT